MPENIHLFLQQEKHDLDQDKTKCTRLTSMHNFEPAKTDICRAGLLKHQGV